MNEKAAGITGFLKHAITLLSLVYLLIYCYYMINISSWRFLWFLIVDTGSVLSLSQLLPYVIILPIMCYFLTILV